MSGEGFVLVGCSLGSLQRRLIGVDSRLMNNSALVCISRGGLQFVPGIRVGADLRGGRRARRRECLCTHESV